MYYDDRAKTKVVTLRMSQKEYDQLQELVVKLSKKSYWPRKTVSSVASAMVCHCLKNNVDFKMY